MDSLSADGHQLEPSRRSDSRMLLAQINETINVNAKVGVVEIKTGSGRARALYKSVVNMDLKNLEAHAALARNRWRSMNTRKRFAVTRRWKCSARSGSGSTA